MSDLARNVNNQKINNLKYRRVIISTSTKYRQVNDICRQNYNVCHWVVDTWNIYMFIFNSIKVCPTRTTWVEILFKSFYVLTFLLETAPGYTCHVYIFESFPPDRNTESTSAYHRTSQVNSAILINFRECH